MVPYLHTVFVLLRINYTIFGAKKASNFKNYAETIPCHGVIWDEFSEQHQHQIMNKHHV